MSLVAVLTAAGAPTSSASPGNRSADEGRGQGRVDATLARVGHVLGEVQGGLRVIRIRGQLLVAIVDGLGRLPVVGATDGQVRRAERSVSASFFEAPSRLPKTSPCSLVYLSLKALMYCLRCVSVIAGRLPSSRPSVAL